MEKQVTLLVNELRRIATALENMNKIKVEKNKLDLKSLFRQGELDYLLSTHKKETK